MNVRCPECATGFRLPPLPPTPQGRRLRLRCKRCAHEFVVNVPGSGTPEEQANKPAPRTMALDAIVGPPPSAAPPDPPVAPAPIAPVRPIAPAFSAAPLPVGPAGLGTMEPSFPAHALPGRGAAPLPVSPAGLGILEPSFPAGIGLGASVGQGLPLSPQGLGGMERSTPSASDGSADASQGLPLSPQGLGGMERSTPSAGPPPRPTAALPALGGAPPQRKTAALPPITMPAPRPPSALDLLGPAPPSALASPTRMLDEVRSFADAGLSEMPELAAPAPAGLRRPMDDFGLSNLPLLDLDPPRPAPAPPAREALPRNAIPAGRTMTLAAIVPPQGAALPPAMQDDNAISGLHRNDAMDLFGSSFGDADPSAGQRQSVARSSDLARDVATRAIAQALGRPGPDVAEVSRDPARYAEGKIDPMFEFRDAFRELRAEEGKAPAQDLMRLVDEDAPLEPVGPSRFELDAAQEAMREAVHAQDTTEESALLNLALLQQERTATSRAPGTPPPPVAESLVDVSISRGQSNLIQLDVAADAAKRAARDQSWAWRWLAQALWVQLGVAVWLGAVAVHAGSLPRAAALPAQTLQMVRAWLPLPAHLQGDALASPRAAGPLRVTRIAATWYPTTSGAWLLIVQGDVGNRCDTALREVQVLVRAQSPEGTTLEVPAIVGTTLPQADLERYADDPVGVRQLAQGLVADFALAPGARAPFQAMFVVATPADRWRVASEAQPSAFAAAGVGASEPPAVATPSADPGAAVAEGSATAAATAEGSEGQGE